MKKKLFLILLTVAIVLTTASVMLINSFAADDDVAAVYASGSETAASTHTTLAAAIDAAEALGDGATIKLLKSFTDDTLNQVEIAKNITIDGSNGNGGTYTITSNKGYLFWVRGSATFQNLTVNAVGGMRWSDLDDSKTSVLTLDNVTWNISNTAFCNMGGNTSTAVNQGDAADGVDMRMNLVNGTKIIKKNGNGEPIICTYSSATEGDYEINVTNSTIAYDGTSTGGVAAGSIIYNNNGTSFKLNLNDGAKLYGNMKNMQNSTSHGNRTMIGATTWTEVTVNLAAGAEVIYGPYEPSTALDFGRLTDLYFTDNNNGTVNDNGATWTISEAIIKHNQKANVGARSGCGASTYNFVGDITCRLPNSSNGYESTAIEGIEYYSQKNVMLFHGSGASFVKNSSAVNVAQITETSTSYTTLAAAITAATEGQTIVLLQNFVESPATILAKGVTIDGNEKTILSSGNSWFWVIKDNATIQDVTLLGARGFKIQQTLATDITVTCTNVTSTAAVDASILTEQTGTGKINLSLDQCNFKNTASGQPLINLAASGAVTTVNITGTTLEKTTGSLMFNFGGSIQDTTINIQDSQLTNSSNKSMFTSAASTAEISINIEDSTVTQNGGVTGSLPNSAIIRANAQADATLNVNLTGTTKLVLNCVKETGTSKHRAMISSEAGTTNVSVGANVTLEFGSATEKDFGAINQMHFIYDEGSFADYWTSVTIDPAATWKVNAYSPKVVLPKAVREGKIALVDTTGNILAKPTAVTAGTYKLSGLVDASILAGLTNKDGASIRNSAGITGIRFTSNVSDTLYNTLGNAAKYGLKAILVKSTSTEIANAYVDFTKYDASWKNVWELDGADAGWKWAVEGEEYRTVLYNIPTASFDDIFCVNSYVDITYSDGSTARYYADYNATENSRSYYYVAQAAIDAGSSSDTLQGVVDTVKVNSEISALTSALQTIIGKAPTDTFNSSINSTELVYTGVTSFNWTLPTGFTTVQSNNWNNNLYYTIKGEALVASIAYIPEKDEVRVVYEDIDTTDLSMLNSANATYGAATITQVGLSGLDGAAADFPGNGMAYIIKLANGKFVVIDGGHNKDTAEALYNVMANQADSDTFTVAAWIFTHAHGDHISSFLKLADGYREKITVESFIFNFSASDVITKADASTLSSGHTNWDAEKGTIISAYQTLAQYYPTAKLVNAHTGQKLYVGNITINMLFTGEMIYSTSNLITYNNDTSMVFRIDLNATASNTMKFMVLGDAGANTGSWLKAVYSTTELSSHIMQVAHHGIGSSPNSGNGKGLYSLISPVYKLWPMGDNGSDTDASNYFNYINAGHNSVLFGKSDGVANTFSTTSLPTFENNYIYLAGRTIVVIEMDAAGEVAVPVKYATHADYLT